jgi:hypothetical protein
MADVLDGAYDLIDSVASLRVAPESTIAQLRRHERELYAAVESGSAESQWRAVESLDPGMAERLRTWMQGKPAKAASFVLVAVLMGMLNWIGERLIEAGVESSGVGTLSPLPAPTTPLVPTLEPSGTAGPSDAPSAP